MFPLPWHCLFLEASQTLFFPWCLPWFHCTNHQNWKYHAIHLTRSSPAPMISSLLHSCPGLATYWCMCKCCITYLLTTTLILHAHMGHKAKSFFPHCSNIPKDRRLWKVVTLIKINLVNFTIGWLSTICCWERNLPTQDYLGDYGKGTFINCG